MSKNTRVREEGAPKRIPLTEQKKSLLTCPEKPGFVRRWVNDKPEDKGQRIAAFQKAGWRIVEDTVQVGDLGVENQNQSIGSGARKFVGQGTHAVLMEIEKKYFDEDQALKAERIAEIERAIYSGKDVEGKYGKIEQSDR
jgi:hypothetical protein